MTTESPETLNIRYVAFDHARKLMHPGADAADVVKRAGEIERYLKGEKAPVAPFAPLPPLDRIMIDTKYLPVGSTCIVNSFFGNQYEIKRVR